MNIDKLVSSYFGPTLNPRILQGIYEEVFAEIKETNMSQPLIETGVEKGFKRQSLRLPNLVATEISVGQKPGSEAREMMEMWLGNIAPGGTLEDKISAIAAFVRRPPPESTIAETLSYLMFLQSFAYILKEFNPSVAGYLWEPLLAVLFGGRGKNASVQVPTTEHDISDIRIFYDESLQPISLKILRKEGQVGGSFVDLVKFFGGRVTGKPEEKMTYVVIAKVAPRKTVNTMNFYKFELTRESFMDWIGHKKIDVKTEWAWKKVNFKERQGLDWEVGDDGYYISTATTRGAKYKGGEQFPWLRVFDKRGKALKNATQYLKIDGRPVEEKEQFVPDATYEAYMPTYRRGGIGGRTLNITNTFLDDYIKKAHEIWGSTEEIDRWRELADDPDVDFFGAIMNGIDYNFSDGATHLDPAPGYLRNEQFDISANYYREQAEDLGSISIDDRRIRKTFDQGAKICGENLTNIFNSLADLTDNISRFFLVDCGGQECTDKDAVLQAQEGARAIQNAAILKQSVDTAIKEGPDALGSIKDDGDGTLTR